MNSQNNQEGRSFRLVPERINYSQKIVDQLISIEKVSELIVSFKKTLIESRMSTQILRDFCQG